MAKERLDKALGHMGVGSRKEIREMVRRGRITVDEQLATDPGQSVEPGAQVIVVDGIAVAFQRHFYVLLHKPGGLITATTDAKKSTVMDALPAELRHRDLFPVGRLDRDTEGLLFLTTDGDLAHRLLSPKWHVDKRYFARVDLPLTPKDIHAFAKGVRLDDGYACMPARLEILAPLEAVCTIQEGKYHQVKRMFEVRGKSVVYLKRLTMGPLALGDLPLGEARPLTEPEIVELYASAALARP
jgi:16S rRNA pseudouridine516 synthase